MKTVEIAGGGGGFRRSLSASFKEAGCTAASAGESLDMFVFVIDPPPCSPTDYGALLSAYESTAMALLEQTAAALPRLEKGTTRRLCFVNRLSSSVNLAGSMEGGFERMAAAASNMAVMTLFNRLRPLGYTFRLYGAADLSGGGECGCIAEYCLENRSLEEESPRHSDENRLVMRDKHEVEYPF
ncbi:MAG: hypothetical protein LBB77_11160 [Treponema sp.]|jgi:hypothetical protein|nr:hypothetical protein [Treponema sp.]